MYPPERVVRQANSAHTAFRTYLPYCRPTLPCWGGSHSLNPCSAGYVPPPLAWKLLWPLCRGFLFENDPLRDPLLDVLARYLSCRNR